MTACLLVVAKAPVAGLAKTRLGRVIGDEWAARLAAAALLDTLDAVLATPDTIPVVALTGRLAAAERSGELADTLTSCTVFSQQGTDFAGRLAHAHRSVGSLFPGVPVFQIGMDTPQLRPPMLTGAVARLRADGTDAVLGPAEDGGWWGLGLRAPADAEALRAVPMSRSDTGLRTLSALRRRGLRVRPLATLSDVDTMADALRVAALAPESRFGRAVEELRPAEAVR
ncbi:TIGR04282 family arsenosugar biosynthesis glycosyltransferase [Actinophytocola sp.]|uniref:TIGR04282 family arsenosugar biosynthesis glycosyltransferase n=1 Tax=Actinophytocola sp. TaxID=1872138 RepID=UPI002ED93856